MSTPVQKGIGAPVSIWKLLVNSKIVFFRFLKTKSQYIQLDDYISVLIRGGRFTSCGRVITRENILTYLINSNKKGSVMLDLLYMSY